MLPGVPKTIDHPKKMPSAVVARNLHLRLSQRQHSENIIAHITRQQLQNREILQGRCHWRLVQNSEAPIEHQRYWSNISSLNCVISAAGHAVRVRRGGSEGIGTGRGFAMAARKSPFYGNTPSRWYIWSCISVFLRAVNLRSKLRGFHSPCEERVRISEGGRCFQNRSVHPRLHYVQFPARWRRWMRWARVYQLCIARIISMLLPSRGWCFEFGLFTCHWVCCLLSASLQK